MSRCRGREVAEAPSAFVPQGLIRLLAALAVAGGAIVSAQTMETRFAVERPVKVERPGPQRLVVDAPLLAAATAFRVVRRGEAAVAEGGLADLRFFDAAGNPVPYLVVGPPSREPEWIGATIAPIAATRKSSGFEVDLGAPADIDALRIDGLPAPHLKRLTLEGSGDRRRWTMLVAEGTVFDLPAERLRQDTLVFPHGSFRYLRVVWDDTNSGRLPLPRAASTRRVTTAPATPPSKMAIDFQRRPSEPGRSRYRLRLPGGRIPAVALELAVAGGHLFRPAAVTEARLDGSEARPVDLGRTMLSRVVRDGVTASSLRIPIQQPTAAELELTIEDGANTPLEIAGVELVFAELPWIYFEPVGPVTARYGNPRLDAPRYDLEAVRASLDLRSLPEASWADPRPLVEAADTPAPDLPSRGASIDATRFRYLREIRDHDGRLVALPLDVSVLAHSRGPAARFADVRVLDASGRQIPYLLERRDEPLSIDLTMKPAQNARPPELADTTSGSRSIYAVTLPDRGLPEGTLVLETAARVFQRTVRIATERPPDRRRRDAWLDTIGTSAWRHADDQFPAPALTQRLSSLDDTRLLVIVEEGDNAPLPIASARLLLPSYRLRFFHPGGETLRLAYGLATLDQPRYDLALLAPQVLVAAATEVEAAPESGAEAADLTDGFIPRWLFWTVLVVAVAVILGVIVRLVVRGS